MKSFDELLRDAEIAHGHLCAGQVLGAFGLTEPGVEVILDGTGQGTVADDAGRFAFTGVPLAQGTQTFTVHATDVAGNSAALSCTITRVAIPAPQNAVLAWNNATLEAIRLDDSTPPVASRALAMVHSAIYDAVNAIAGSPTLYTSESAAPGASPEAALAAAAHAITRSEPQKETYRLPGPHLRLRYSRRTID